MKKTEIDQIEVCKDGTIQVRMKKLLIDEDGMVHDLGYHRTAIPPGHDSEKQMSVVNQDLVRMGLGEVPDVELKRIYDIVPVVHTDEVIEAYKEKMETEVIKG